MEKKDEEVLDEVKEEVKEETKEETKEELTDEVETEIVEELKDEETKEDEKVEVTEVKEEVKSTKKVDDKKKKIIVSCILVGIIVACLLAAVLPRLLTPKTEEKEKKIETEKKDYKSELRMTGNGLQDFDLAFLKLENEGKNKVYSPLSIKYALAMLQEGAEGDSREQINAIIGDYKSKKYINSQHMSFANAMFIRTTYKEMVNKDYSTNLSEKYNAELIYDDFSTANNINGWVNQKTLGLIDKLYNDNDVRDAKFYLVNALAIDMDWKEMLQRYWTVGSNYYITYQHEDYKDSIGVIDNSNQADIKYQCINFNNNQKIEVSELGATINNYDIVKTLGKDNIIKELTPEYEAWLKSEEGQIAVKYNPDVTDVNANLEEFVKELDSNYKKYRYSTDFKFNVDDDVKVFAKELKEYDGLTLEYVAIMPKKVELKDFVNNITAKELNEKISDLKEPLPENVSEGKVTRIVGNIPLFKYDDKLDLKSDLKKLGITDVFNIEKANLSKIAKDDKELVISSADHKATIEFSNEGIKAAAVTAVGGAGSASGVSFEHIYEVPVEIIDLNFDKPYMYIIRDKATGEVWFTGTVYNPNINKHNDCKISERNVYKKKSN